jgi:hypothetical protein
MILNIAKSESRITRQSWSDQEQEKHKKQEKSQKKECLAQQQKEGIHRRYEQYNVCKDKEKKDEQNE